MPNEPLPRFVILRHALPTTDARGLHWDFMLEVAGSLRTWALEAEPAENRLIVAEALADHRLQYLDYEGPISAGRGEVNRWDAGQYVLEREHDGEMVVHLTGSRLRGQVTLIRRRPKDHRWTFSFVADSNSA